MKRVLFLFLTFFFLVSPLSAEPRIIDKDIFISTFMEKAEIVKSFQQKIVAAEADYDKVLAQYFPQIKISFGVGPHPKYTYNKETVTWEDPVVKENIVFTPANWDKSSWTDISTWGVALRLKAEFVLPIYTFGRFVNGRDAAEGQIEVKKAEAEIGKLKLRQQATALYYSWVMAQDIMTSMKPALADVETAENTLKKWIYEEKEGVSQKDLIKLRIEKEKMLYQIKKLELNISTFRSVLNEVFGENWEIKDRFMYKAEFEKKEEELKDYLITKSPYAKLMKNGLSAYENLYDYEVSNFFPLLGLAGNFSMKYTSSIDEKNYPDPNSPYNGTDGEIGIGLIFNLNILDQITKVKKAKAQWKSMEYEMLFAKRMAGVQLKTKYNELLALESQIRHIKKAHKYSKGWMTMEVANHETGFGKTGDLVDSVKSFYDNELKLVQSYYEYNMKVEEIIALTGIE